MLICESCSEAIEQIDDLWVEWWKILEKGNKALFAGGLRICHSNNASPRAGYCNRYAKIEEKAHKHGAWLQDLPGQSFYDPKKPIEYAVTYLRTLESGYHWLDDSFSKLPPAVLTLVANLDKQTRGQDNGSAGNV